MLRPRAEMVISRFPSPAFDASTVNSTGFPMVPHGTEDTKTYHMKQFSLNLSLGLQGYISSYDIETVLPDLWGVVGFSCEGCPADRDVVVVDGDDVGADLLGQKLSQEPILDITRHLDKEEQC